MYTVEAEYIQCVSRASAAAAERLEGGMENQKSTHRNKRKSTNTNI